MSKEQAATATSAQAAGLHCVTQDPRERAAPAALTVCDDNPTDVACSRWCPPGCGGHLVCAPCLNVARGMGLAP